MDISQIIKAGETNTVEFKSWVKTPNYKEMIDLLVKEAVGLANTKGGICNRQVELNNFPQIILNSFLQLRFNSLLN